MGGSRSKWVNVLPRLISLAVVFLLTGCAELTHFADLCHHNQFKVMNPIVGDDPDELCDKVSGECRTLRSAINTATLCGGRGSDKEQKTVVLPADAVFTIKHTALPLLYFQHDAFPILDNIGPTGLPLIFGDTVIQGNGATIQRAADAPDFRLLYVYNSGRLALHNLTLRNGRQLSQERDYNGGAIRNDGTLLLDHVSLLGNKAQADGAAIYNGIGAKLVIRRSRITGNGHPTPTGINRSHSASILALMKDSSVRLSEVVFSNNYSYDATVRDMGRLTIEQTTFYGNRSLGVGVVLHDSDQLFSLRRSTLTDNRGNQAGALSCSAGRMFLEDTTLYQNNIDRGQNDGTTQRGGVVIGKRCTFAVSNSIIAGSQPKNCVGPGVDAAWTRGQNLDDDNSCPGFTTSKYMGLSSLTDNGGFAPTLMLKADSPAIDAGTVCLSPDQREGSRPLDGHGDTQALCDIGAVEFNPATAKSQ